MKINEDINWNVMKKVKILIEMLWRLMKIYNLIAHQYVLEYQRHLLMSYHDSMLSYPGLYDLEKDWNYFYKCCEQSIYPI